MADIQWSQEIIWLVARDITDALNPVLKGAIKENEDQTFTWEAPTSMDEDGNQLYNSGVCDSIEEAKNKVIIKI